MNHLYPAHPVSKSGFALISVLALVSLAALTATAFLASARLERQATRPIGETTRLQMTLNTGRECASEVFNRIGEPYWNFVTTYWRTNSADELGYLFVGKPSAPNNLVWYYYCGFTPKQWTNLDSADMNTRIRATNTICQATYSNNMQTFMSNATSGFSVSPGFTNPTCVQIPLLGGRTSPSVGWVYIKQDIRTNPSSTTTSNLPVARFAYFTEDLGGLIDADRMCGTNTRNTGTNAEEISLANLAGSSASSIAIATFTNKRPQYLTPGMLLAANGGVLTDTNDLRYFASRLRYCNWTVNNNWDRIPMVPISSSLVNGSFYPSQAGQRKTNLNSNNMLTANGAIQIAATINSNYPMFTNRAGGMNGSNYVSALAANIVDYADTDPLPTTLNNIPIAGFDAYPLPTIIYDQMVLGPKGTDLTLTPYWQFWNLSTKTSPAASYNYTYDFADTLGKWTTNTNTGYVTAGSNTRLVANPFTGTVSIPSLPPGACLVTNIFTTNINLTPLLTGYNASTTVINLWINGTTNGAYTSSNSLTLKINAAAQPFLKMNIGYERKARSFDNTGPNATKWAGACPGLRYDNVSKGTPPIGDPRMILYYTNSANNGWLSATDYDQNIEWGLGYAQTRTATYSNFPYSGHPGNWPDGTNTGNPPGVLAPQLPKGSIYPDSTNPTVGIFSNNVMPVGKLSTNANGLFTNICELGNIFDPMQWAGASTIIGTPPNWVDDDIAAGNLWAANSMYGGGQTLRIGRAEHSRFAFTNLTNAANSYPVPALGTSAAGLLDIFCVTNTYNWAGRININTAPPPVLAALAGGITLAKDTNMTGTAVNTTMINAFTNGVMKFRNLYPFITPSQLAFISTNYGTNNWTNTISWSSNAVFSPKTGLQGVTKCNDEGREEWFSKIYNLTCVQSFNYRIYVVAQLTDTNGNPKGAMMRKYYQLHLRHNQPTPDNTDPANRDKDAPSVSPVVTYEAFY